MPTLFIFGLGYTASRLAARLRAEGWRVTGTGRAGDVAFDDPAAVLPGLAGATHLLSSVPPKEERDPVLAAYGEAIRDFGGWRGYLSSTGVYGDSGGAWVDESAPIGAGRRTARAEADAAWQALGAHVFRRIHVDDIGSGVIAGFGAPPGAYNLADDLPCAQNQVIEHAAMLLGVAPPPLLAIDDAGLSPGARAFYSENRRVANGKAKRVLGWRPAFPDYRAGLGALSANNSPTSASAQPAMASGDQR